MGSAILAAAEGEEVTATRLATILLALALGAPASAEEPLRVGGQISAPVKIKNVFPVYPQELKDAGVQDVVFLEATINEEGAVVDLHALHGVPDLVKASEAAVRQWRYHPVRLNGEPTPVVFTITVAYFLSGAPRGPVMAKVLEDPNEQVRLKAVRFLTGQSLTDFEALKLLEGLLDDPSPEVREAAARAIEWRNDKK